MNRVIISDFVPNCSVTDDEIVSNDEGNNKAGLSFGEYSESLMVGKDSVFCTDARASETTCLRVLMC